MIERNKEHHTQSLNELQQEMKSLKALLLNRPTGVPTSPSPLPLTARPSIPAWQLAGSTTSSTTPGMAKTNNEPPLNGISSSTYPAGVPIPINNGKGKETETEAIASSSSAS